MILKGLGEDLGRDFKDLERILDSERTWRGFRKGFQGLGEDPLLRLCVCLSVCMSVCKSVCCPPVLRLGACVCNLQSELIICGRASVSVISK